MKTTKIRIKNVDRTPESAGCILELKRAGFPEGSIIHGAKYNPENNSYRWQDCVAYVGQTCEVI